MGSRVTKEYWCDTCGETFKNEWTWYHKHIKYAGGSALFNLEQRIENAENEEEAFNELASKFGFSKGTSPCNVSHALYDEKLIHCMVKGMRENMIHNENAECECECSNWYKSNDKVADFIEKSIPKLKIAYNNLINRAIQEAEDESRNKISHLQDRLLNIE